jgi:hypothetical protein
VPVEVLVPLPRGALSGSHGDVLDRGDLRPGDAGLSHEPDASVTPRHLRRGEAFAIDRSEAPRTTHAVNKRTRPPTLKLSMTTGFAGDRDRTRPRATSESDAQDAATVVEVVVRAPSGATSRGGRSCPESATSGAPCRRAARRGEDMPVRTARAAVPVTRGSPATGRAASCASAGSSAGAPSPA